MSEEQLRNVKGRFNKVNYEENNKIYDVELMKEYLKKGKMLWQIPFIKDHYYEDNDTESDSDEDEEEGLKSMMSVLQNMLAGKQMGPHDLPGMKKSGLKLFVDQEKKQLRQIDR